MDFVRTVIMAKVNINKEHFKINCVERIILEDEELKKMIKECFLDYEDCYELVKTWQRILKGRSNDY